MIVTFIHDSIRIEDISVEEAVYLKSHGFFSFNEPNIDFIGNAMDSESCNIQEADSSFNPKTVNIGNQVWMAENLAVDDGGEGIYKNPDNNEYYYTWEAAMRLAKSTPGWHLPTALEWNEAALACGTTEMTYEGNPNLNDYEDAQELKDKLGVKLAGYYDGSFSYVGSNANFWTSTEDSSTYAYYRYFSTGTSMVSNDSIKDSGYSVRLVKDSA